MKKISKITIFFISILFLTYCNKSEKLIVEKQQIKNEIICTDIGCSGYYEGPEFENGSDIAHQFSNEMSKKVGEKLKELYKAKLFSKVDFQKIEMSTIGMNSGTVKYELMIPFSKMDNECEACTSFDHVGGWNHTPALKERKIQLKNVLKQGESLDISELKTTPEGLQEYWIQWKNKDLQKDCE